MRIAHLAMLSGAALLISASAFAADTQTASTDASGTQNEPLICRAMVHEGMVMTHATQCHTQRWWDRVRHDQEKAISDMQIRSSQHGY